MLLDTLRFQNPKTMANPCKSTCSLISLQPTSKILQVLFRVTPAVQFAYVCSLFVFLFWGGGATSQGMGMNRDAMNDKDTD